MRNYVRSKGAGQAGREVAAPHLGLGHPLAVVAGRWCEQHLGPVRRRQVGSVACGACWERAIRDDERIAVDFGLPRELDVDPMFVDWVAVERACRGERVALTVVERRAAVVELAGRGLTPWQIAKRLSMNYATAQQLTESDGAVA